MALEDRLTMSTDNCSLHLLRHLFPQLQVKVEQTDKQKEEAQDSKLKAQKLKAKQVRCLCAPTARAIRAMAHAPTNALTCRISSLSRQTDKQCTMHCSSRSGPQPARCFCPCALLLCTTWKSMTAAQMYLQPFGAPKRIVLQYVPRPSPPLMFTHASTITCSMNCLILVLLSTPSTAQYHEAPAECCFAGMQPVPTMSGHMDNAVLERMAKIMSYMRVSAGKPSKKPKKKDKLAALLGISGAPGANFPIVHGTDNILPKPAGAALCHSITLHIVLCWFGDQFQLHSFSNTNLGLVM